MLRLDYGMELKYFLFKDDTQKIECIKQWQTKILRGNVLLVVKDMKTMAQSAKLSPTKQEVIKDICRYFKRNSHRMQYHKYLQAGYPIATGVLEGACRHFVKDRFERARMKWSIPGAQAMLELRTIYLNGDWDDYFQFHICGFA